jgi:membrane protein
VPARFPTHRSAGIVTQNARGGAKHQSTMAKDEDRGADWRATVGEPEPAATSVDAARAREPGRGREAMTPEEIPARGWRDIFWRVIFAVSSDRVLSTAGSVAFFALLAVFPGIATVVSLYGLFADPSTIGKHLVILSGILPAGVLELISGQIVLIATQSGKTLGTAFLIGLGIALWSANSGVVALFDALNVVYDEKEKRSLVRLYGTTFLFTLGAVAFAVVALVGVIVLPIVLSGLGMPPLTERVLSILRWPILLGSVMATLAFVYRFGPSRNEARWRWVTWGSVVGALLWVAASMLFSAYVANFDSYNNTYGSLGAAVGFMVWLWLSMVVVLLGAEVNAEMEHQTARDTTEGRPKPLGARGAMMADHVGEAQG